MNSKNLKWAALGLAIMLCTALTTNWLIRSVRNGAEDRLDLTQEAKNRRGSGKEGQFREVEPGYVIVGGVKRKISEVRSLRKKRHADQKTSKDSDSVRDPFDYGTTKPVPADLNPQVESVVEAIRTKQYPERLSVLMRPKKFDAVAYMKDPEKYINTIEPGRVFQPAQPGPGVPRIRPVSRFFHNVIQGGPPAVLKVKVTPGSPVTFTSFDLGEFQNRLTSITVKADKQGLAQTKFYGTSGTIADVNILAASPATAGQVKFIVNIKLPDDGGDTVGTVENTAE